MSRLDSFIRRLTAQRACLDRAADLIAGLPGPVLELGLGNGRTYDHLRERLPGRDIYVLERQVAAHPASRPDGAHLILGDFRETLPGLRGRLGAPVALAHADFGSGDRAATAALAAWLGPALAPLLAPGGILCADQPLAADGLRLLEPPAGVPPQRYFLYQRAP